jgi:hypothetical protein
MTKPASIRRCRASSVFLRQMLYEELRMRILPMWKMVLIPFALNFA